MPRKHHRHHRYTTGTLAPSRAASLLQDLAPPVTTTEPLVTTYSKAARLAGVEHQEIVRAVRDGALATVPDPNPNPDPEGRPRKVIVLGDLRDWFRRTHPDIARRF